MAIPMLFIPPTLFNVPSTHPTENQQVTLTIDSLSSTCNKIVDLEHPSHEEVSTERKLKGKDPSYRTYSESSVAKPNLKYEDIFPNIIAHLVKFAYIV
jgi:hypothetical protein